MGPGLSEQEPGFRGGNFCYAHISGSFDRGKMLQAKILGVRGKTKWWW